MDWKDKRLWIGITVIVVLVIVVVAVNLNIRCLDCVEGITLTCQDNSECKYLDIAPVPGPPGCYNLEEPDKWNINNNIHCGCENNKCVAVTEESNCAREGESPNIIDMTTGKPLVNPKPCCEGLKAISQISCDEKTGICGQTTGSQGICSPCGNGVCDSYENDDNCPEDCEYSEVGLLKDIEDGKSIMGIWPHPDDECLTPGIFAVAASKGNKCWIVTLIGMSSPPYSENPEIRQARIDAIDWFKEQYLEEYIMFDMLREPGTGWHGWTWSFEEIKAYYKAEIEEKKPDILLTFTPHGYMDNTEGEHAWISNMVTEIREELDYNPKIYWFINTDQGPRSDGPFDEDEKYPPTDVINLDVYSDTVGMTYWEAKLEFWEHYSPSVGALNRWMETPGNLENNDRKEYFFSP